MIKTTLIVKEIKAAFNKNMRLENVKKYKKAVFRKIILSSNDMLNDANNSFKILKKSSIKK